MYFLDTVVVTIHSGCLPPARGSTIINKDRKRNLRENTQSFNIVLLFHSTRFLCQLQPVKLFVRIFFSAGGQISLKSLGEDKSVFKIGRGQISGKGML